MLLKVDPNTISPNPWQPRVKMDPAQLEELADSIRANGLLSPPMGRELQQAKGHYQLAFGHRRLAAWKQGRPGEPFPLDVQELSDRQMAEHAATENGQREDLNPVERARGLKRLIDEFSMTQAEAGKLYGLATQGAVSNAVRLLELPDKVLDLVAEGVLIEKDARQLILVGRFDPAGAAEIAAQYLKGLERQAQHGYGASDVKDLVTGFIEHKGKRLQDDQWPLDWVPKDLSVKPKGEPAYEVPACKGCLFMQEGRWGTSYCMREQCFKAKQGAYSQQAAGLAAEKLGIPLAKPGESVKVIYTGNWNEGELADKLLKTKPAHLRLVPCSLGNHQWERRNKLGSHWVALATTDAKLIEQLKVTAAERAYAGPTAKDREQQQAERKRRQEHVMAMADKVIPLLAEALPLADGVLEFLWDSSLADTWRFDKDWKKAKATKDRRIILVRALLEEDLGDYGASANDPDEAATMLKQAAKRLKVKLPAGWDTSPAEMQAKPAANGKAKPKGKAKK